MSRSMDAIKAGKTVQVVSPNKEYAEALYAEAEARIRDSEDALLTDDEIAEQFADIAALERLRLDRKAAS